MFGKCVLTAANHARGLQRFVGFVGSVLSTKKACRKLAKLWRVCFDHGKSCRRLAEIPRVRFVHHKACRRLLEVCRVRLVHRKACKRIANVRRVRFDTGKSCRRLADVRIQTSASLQRYEVHTKISMISLFTLSIPKTV